MLQAVVVAKCAESFHYLPTRVGTTWQKLENELTVEGGQNFFHSLLTSANLNPETTHEWVYRAWVCFLAVSHSGLKFRAILQCRVSLWGRFFFCPGPLWPDPGQHHTYPGHFLVSSSWWWCRQVLGRTRRCSAVSK